MKRMFALKFKAFLDSFHIKMKANSKKTIMSREGRIR